MWTEYKEKLLQLWNTVGSLAERNLIPVLHLTNLIEGSSLQATEDMSMKP